MNMKLHNQNGEEKGSIELPSDIFEVPMNPDVVHFAVQAQMSNARKSVAHTKDRGEVRGGGKKPWRQKGTGRARHASIRSPIWKGGGVAFGPTRERNFYKKINQKVFRKALKMVLSAKAREGEIFILDQLSFTEAKTRQATAVLKNFIKPTDSVIIITPQKDRSIERAARNIKRTGVISADSLNVRDLLAKKYLMLVKDGIPVITKLYS